MPLTPTQLRATVSTRLANLPREVYVMGGVAFCVALGFGIVAPAIPLFAQEFGVSATAAGAVVSAFALMRFVTGPAAGWVVDRIGVRTSLLIGLVVVGLSSLFAGLSGDYEQLIVLRGIGGIGSALFGVAAISVVLHVAAAHVRARAMGVYRSGFLIGGIVGPAFGGAVLAFSFRVPFFLYAGTLALAAAVAVVFLARPTRGAASVEEGPVEGGPAEGGPLEVGSVEVGSSEVGSVEGGSVEVEPAEEISREVRQAPGPTLREVLRTRQYQAALTSNLAIGFISLGLRSAIVPLFIHDAIGAPDWWVGPAFVVSALVQMALMYPAGSWADRVGRRPALVVGAGVTAGSLVLLGFSGSMAFVMIAMAVFGAGSAFLGTVPGALVGDVAGKRSGVVIAVFNMASDVGAVAGPVVAGWLVDQGSYLTAFSVGAGVAVLAGVLALRLPQGVGVKDEAGSASQTVAR
ncbi:MAG TPA: MFS transporter [Segeticoccus sp.]|uniref:MFS transporter n=1 Tax=Segeticoccus sp. TaxID=2706531 RepID=UPI002D800CA6|nr:MFS transporter [Segeticoccus sp.]HET8600192.1 MFS transporter [Segeticoccus sp.]